MEEEQQVQSRRQEAARAAATATAARPLARALEAYHDALEARELARAALKRWSRSRSRSRQRKLG